MEKVISFVLSRETEEGGFSFAKTTPKTLDDTYYALKTFELLNYGYRSQKILEYIESIQVDELTPPKIVYQASYLFRILQRNLRSTPEVNHKLKSRISCPSISDLRTMDNVLRQLLLMHQLGIPFNRSVYVEWIKNSQNGDGGFGFLPGTSSFLENTYYALRTLSLLSSRPRDLQGCRCFIQRCQASNGGFGRQNHHRPQSGEHLPSSVQSVQIGKDEAKLL